MLPRGCLHLLYVWQQYVFTVATSLWYFNIIFCLGKLSCPSHELLVMSPGEEGLLKDSFVVVLLLSVYGVEHPFCK